MKRLLCALPFAISLAHALDSNEQLQEFQQTIDQNNQNELELSASSSSSELADLYSKWSESLEKFSAGDDSRDFWIVAVEILKVDTEHFTNLVEDLSERISLGPKLEARIEASWNKVKKDPKYSGLILQHKEERHPLEGTSSSASKIKKPPSKKAKLKEQNLFEMARQLAKSGNG